MALVDIEDVRDHLPQIEITANSRPTEAAVVEWIGDIEQQLYATVQNLTPKTLPREGVCAVTYVLPIDPLASPITASILKEMILHAITARVLRSRIYGVGDVNASGAKEAQAFYDDRIKQLADPAHPFSLPDAVVEEETACSDWFSGMVAFGDTSGNGYRPRPTMRTIF